METRSCWHFNRCTLPPTSTKAKHPQSCWRFNHCKLPPTSTKAKHPSSQTEKMCLETEFESYKALLVIVVVSFELIHISLARVIFSMRVICTTAAYILPSDAPLFSLSMNGNRICYIFAFLATVLLFAARVRDGQSWINTLTAVFSWVTRLLTRTSVTWTMGTLASGLVKTSHHCIFDESWYLHSSNRPPAAQILGINGVSHCT